MNLSISALPEVGVTENNPTLGGAFVTTETVADERIVNGLLDAAQVNVNAKVTPAGKMFSGSLSNTVVSPGDTSLATGLRATADNWEFTVSSLTDHAAVDTCSVLTVPDNVRIEFGLNLPVSEVDMPTTGRSGAWVATVTDVDALRPVASFTVTETTDVVSREASGANSV
jgi:hypothetical protein